MGIVVVVVGFVEVAVVVDFEVEALLDAIVGLLVTVVGGEVLVVVVATGVVAVIDAVEVVVVVVIFVEAVLLRVVDLSVVLDLDLRSLSRGVVSVTVIDL